MTKKVEYVVCPLCGRNRVLETHAKGRIGWPNGTPLNLRRTKLLQVREGGGKKSGEMGKGYRGSAQGSGFHLVPEDCLTLPEMIESHAYDVVLSEMKDQLIRIVRQSISIGFVRREEVVGKGSVKEGEE